MLGGQDLVAGPSDGRSFGELGEQLKPTDKCHFEAIAAILVIAL